MARAVVVICCWMSLVPVVSFEGVLGVFCVGEDVFFVFVVWVVVGFFFLSHVVGWIVIVFLVCFGVDFVVILFLVIVVVVIVVVIVVWIVVCS